MAELWVLPAWPEGCSESWLFHLPTPSPWAGLQLQANLGDLPVPFAAPHSAGAQEQSRKVEGAPTPHLGQTPLIWELSPSPLLPAFTSDLLPSGECRAQHNFPCGLERV